MKIIGVICEYNPLHNGHARQLSMIRQQYDPCIIVALMSGNYVQRGEPAQFHKSLRAAAAIANGADLVLELPVNYVLSSAEGFAAGGVGILGQFCDVLSFGCESGDAAPLMETARLLLSDEINALIREELEQGISYPAARENALARLGGQRELLQKPNDILGIEYCKAILSQGLPMEVFAVKRGGDYHAPLPEEDNPSASSLRALLSRGEAISPYVPSQSAFLYADASLHGLACGEKAILARLRTMSEEEFAALPFGSEGLWRKLMRESRTQTDLEGILTAVKSKRYTRSRLCRMIMCAFLGITQQVLSAPAEYVRVLAFNDRGRQILRNAQEDNRLPMYHTGQPVEHPHWILEQRCEDLYGLFAPLPEPPGGARRDRAQYFPENPAL